MRLRYDPYFKRWIGKNNDRYILGALHRAAWFAITGHVLPDRLQLVRLRTSKCGGVVTKGLYSPWLYIEFMWGPDICTPTFYRWVIVGIPQHGCWRLRLQKRGR